MLAHKTLVLLDGPSYDWFPRRWRFFWKRLAGSCSRRTIWLNPYVLDVRSQEYVVNILSHEYLHWLLYREFDAKTARKLDQLGRKTHHHNPFFAHLRTCIRENNVRWR